MSELADGLTVMTAATGTQLAYETPGGGSGVFSDLLVDALNGVAANLLGEVTPGSVYVHVDKSLGSWAQRPVFKTNVQSFIALRRADAPIQLSALQSLPVLFPTPDHAFRLDPTFEPERGASDQHLPPPNAANILVFRTLQDMVKVNLVRPVDAPHMWHAAIGSKACELTVLGVHYRNLAANGFL